MTAGCGDLMGSSGPHEVRCGAGPLCGSCRVDREGGQEGAVLVEGRAYRWRRNQRDIHLDPAPPSGAPNSVDPGRSSAYHEERAEAHLHAARVWAAVERESSR